MISREGLESERSLMRLCTSANRMGCTKEVSDVDDYVLFVF